MKRILLSLILISTYIASFGQGDVTRTAPVSPTTSAGNYNKQRIIDANLKVALTFNIPTGTSFTHNNSNPAVGNIFYNTTTNQFGVWNGSIWQIIGASDLSNYYTKTETRTLLRDSLVNYMKISDGLKRLDSIKAVGLTVTAYAPIQWRIGGVNYQKLTNSVFSITSATPSYNRIDLLYATTSNTVLKLEGAENVGVALPPNLPNGTVSVALIYINGSTISPPFPDLSDYLTKPVADELYIKAFKTRPNSPEQVADIAVNGQISASELIRVGETSQITDASGFTRFGANIIKLIQGAGRTISIAEPSTDTYIEGPLRLIYEPLTPPDPAYNFLIRMNSDGQVRQVPASALNGSFIEASPVSPQAANINITGTIRSPRIYSNYFEDLSGDGFVFTPSATQNILFNMGNDGTNFQRIDFGSASSAGAIDLNFNNNKFTLINPPPTTFTGFSSLVRDNATGELKTANLDGSFIQANPSTPQNAYFNIAGSAKMSLTTVVNDDGGHGLNLEGYDNGTNPVTNYELWNADNIGGGGLYLTRGNHNVNTGGIVFKGNEINRISDGAKVLFEGDAPSSGVTSFNSRTGAVSPLSTDYSGFYYPLSGNPSGFLTSFSETDPTVPSYSKSLIAFSVIKSSTDALYEPLFSKNTAFNKNFGTASNTVAEGNDSRILNGQTAFGWGNHATAGYLTSATASSTYVPYTGATGSVNLGANSLTSNANVLTGVASPAYAQGKLVYDTDNESLTFFNNDSNIGLQVGQEEWIKVVNNTGSTIANGSAVYVNGSSGGIPTIALAKADVAATTVGVGLATESIANGSTGYVTALGLVRGLNTSAFSVGAVYISETTAGALTQTAPTAPNYRYRVGFVTNVNASTGTIHVTPSTASLGNGTANQVFGMNAAGTGQEVKSITGASGVIVTNGTNSIAITGDSTSTGFLTKANGLTLAQAQSVQNLGTWKKYVRVATNSFNITLSGLGTFDGVTLVAGDRILVYNQSPHAGDGVYIAASGAWTRATDMDSPAEVNGASIIVKEGTTMAGSSFIQTATVVTVGTTDMTFTQTLSQGTGITISGRFVAVNTSNAFTWGAKHTFFTPTTASASINLPHGVAPTTPVNGDMWSTTANWFVRTNGATKTLATLETANTYTAQQSGTTPTAGDNTTKFATTAFVQTAVSANGFKQAISTKTGAYTVLSTDYTVLGDATTASFTITLPTASTVTGQVFNFKKIDASANTVTIAGTIDGVTNKIITSQYSGFTVQSNGTSYFIIL